MGIDHDINDFVTALDRAPSRFKDEVLRPLARKTIPTKFAKSATQDHMQSGPTTFEDRPPPRSPSTSGPLRKVSLRLSRAVAGEFYEGRRESNTVIRVTPEGLKWTRKINVPYARIHEKGGTVQVPATTKVESAMWALYYETGADRYKAFALATKTKEYFNIRIPARPYIKPAIEDTVPVVVKETERLLGRFLDRVLE